MFCYKVSGKFSPWRGRIVRRQNSSSAPVEASSTTTLSPALPVTVFSGIQPTGSLHLGNYFGAVKLWTEIQNDPTKQLITSVVDMHAITLAWDPKALRANIRRMFIELLACGVDPSKTVLFQQSQVPQHAQLQWIFACLTTMARLDNLPQYKEKSATQSDIPCGLLLYPVLQAADILLYRARLVPVGEDQVHHLQLAQHTARVFNHHHGKLFPSPQRLPSDLPRVKSLREPAKKMSKSEPDTKSRIEVADSPEQIMLKCKRAVTDFPAEITFDPETRPGISNLLLLYKTIRAMEMDAVLEHFRAKDKVALKEELGEAVVELLRPVRENVRHLEGNLEFVERVMEEGAEKARALAADTMRLVENLVGFRSDVKSVKEMFKKPAKTAVAVG
ncbi:Tryptophan--tRNA ligase, mitochondrial [Hypsibius exemplaris]|uniref:tryptophan--tRNA ligase n=1 Tax=Hypsibius exemplaris TaxID=2072580 RepID=A0A1W0WHI6_HYPEX|nr:Tryptophan--tRNA ligase, mitochondrial [Hypsibius exemplaris]